MVKLLYIEISKGGMDHHVRIKKRTDMHFFVSPYLTFRKKEKHKLLFFTLFIFKEVEYIFLILFLFFYSTSIVVAQTQTENINKKVVTGHLENSVTKEPLTGAKVDLLSSDSSFIDSTRTIYNEYGYPTRYSYFKFEITRPGHYIIRCSLPYYKMLYIPVDIKFHKRETEIFLGKYQMQWDPKNKHILKEIIVKATKIKFYHNGDTLVYNADAFQLADGSMLDMLIKQMPEVELKNNGQIFVNGKFVSSLLLNGKDLFKGDNKLILENLPAYMVNKVKVYEKKDELRTSSESDNKSLVMDVKLKKEYSIGWIGNAEGGQGTNHRYLARLLAIRMTPHSGITVWANMNNLNDNQTPEFSGDWNSSDLFNGLQSRKTAGINYGLEDKNGKFSIGERTKIERLDADNQIQTNNVTFLRGGDTYSRSLSVDRNYSTTFSSACDLTLRVNNVLLGFDPEITYNRYNNKSFNLAETFSDEPSKHITTGLLDSLNQSDMGAYLNKITLNRYKQDLLQKGHKLDIRNYLFGRIKIPYTDDVIWIKSLFNYSNAENKTYSHYKLDYPFSSSSVDYRNKYITNPDHNYNYYVNIEYSLNYALTELTKLRFVPYYKYSKTYRSTNNFYYRLDRLEGWGENSAYSLGTLPSTIDYLTSTRDSSNSYSYHQYNYLYETGFSFIWDQKLGTTKHLNLNFVLPLKMEKRKLDYQRNALDTAFTRHTTFLDPNLKIEISDNNSEYNYYFNYDCQSSDPDMTYFVNVTDNTDPLNIIKGNTKLKSTHTHNFTLGYSGNFKNQKMLNIKLEYHAIRNAIAMGSLFYKSTGVRTIKPDNINGNWKGGFNIDYTTPLDKARKLTLIVISNSDFNHSVDLINVEGSTGSSRSTVKNLYLNETLKLEYRFNEKFYCGAKTNLNWTHSTSTREDFTTINAGNFYYGINGQIELPWNMQLSSDITEYSRRGYEETSMNTNELVWNAKLVKRIRGNISIILDGFDILGKLSNVQRTVNAQGRTETYYNVIPRYVMLHAIYRLNIKPKKNNN